MSVPMVIVVVAWLMAIFVGFGLFAPPNPTVIITLAVCALAVSGAIFLRALRISPEPIRDALNQIGH